jgi:hypothetical protein
MTFYGGTVAGCSTPQRVYQLVDQDGTVTYTNIPPRGKR